MDNIQELYFQASGRHPVDCDLFIHEGTLWVFRARTGKWENLGTDRDPAGYQGTGALEYELSPGIIIRGSPAFVFSLVLRAFYSVPKDKAEDFVKFVYSAFKECGWTGPAESDMHARPGVLEFENTTVHQMSIDDVRPILSQLQDPEFNGWLTVENKDYVRFLNVRNAHSISVYETGSAKQQP